MLKAPKTSFVRVLNDVRYKYNQKFSKGNNRFYKQNLHQMKYCTINVHEQKLYQMEHKNFDEAKQLQGI